MKRHSPPGFQPRLEALEDRCTPSTIDLPFKETLTLLSLRGGIATYSGMATHLGKVFAVEYFNPTYNPADPTSVFATYDKYAANGDVLFGRVVPDNPANPFTTGEATIDGGTGRFQGASGDTRYVVSSDAKTGATNVGITGSIDYDPQAGSADPLTAPPDDTQTLPFKITGGGPAPAGLPLVPGVSAPHQATGEANYLGHYTGAGTFTLGSLNISSTGQVTGTFQGSFVFVAANGDRLAMTYGDGFSGRFSGQLTADGTAVVNVTFDAFFTPDPAHSTGRFASVVGGGFRMIANAPSVSLLSGVPGFTAPFDYTWSGEGVLVFAKGK
jgi:hypothetical protein